VTATPEPAARRIGTSEGRGPRRIAIVPAYNEEPMVATVLGRLYPLVDELVVVDDGSTDGTRGAIERWLPGHERCRLLRHETNKGMSEAYHLALTTLRARLDDGELSADDLVFTVDADGQHDLDVLDELVELTIAGDIDAMLARRDLSYHGFYKRFGNGVLSAWASLWAGTRLHDVESGYRIFRLGALAHALDFYKGYQYSETVEVAVVMARLGYHVRNDHVVPVPISRSRTRLRDAVIDAAVIPVAAVRVWRRGPRPDDASPGHEVPGGRIALGFMIAFWAIVIGWYLGHRIVLSSDSMNNYVHVWWIARDLWHHGHLPWGMPVLGHGGAYAYPYGLTNWTFAAVLWPLFGNWAVTLTTALGALGCIAATFFAFPELRRGWWAAAVLANPAIIETLLFGQQAFAWGAALLLIGIGCWRRDRALAAALLVGLAQATHPAIVLPMALLLVAGALVFDRARRAALLRWYALSVVIALPAVALVFASPGYADASTRDRLVNFVGTLAPRILVVLIPIVLVNMRRMGVRAYAPLALVAVLLVNVALEEPLNVKFQWRAFTRYSQTASLDSYLHSDQFVPGATYRVLRGAADAKLGLYHVLRAGGRLDSEMFPESMAVHDFASVDDYAELLCARHVDFVIAYDSYAKSRHTNELSVLQQLAGDPASGVHVIERGPGHAVYRVPRAGCPAS
jgi:glycosyltransferase involved in cell wall biosynthesis